MTIDVFAERWPLVKILNNQKVPAENGWQRDPRRDWRPEELAGFNVGVVCGHGIVVIDVDRHEGRADGFVTLGNLQEAYGRLPETLCVLTPNEGRHFYFRTLETLPNVKLPGVDFLAARKYVVAPPSTLPTGAYEWVDPEAAVADLPEEWVSFWKQEGARPALAPKGVVARTLSDEDVRAMLSHLDPNMSRDLWIRVGMGLHEDARPFELWDEWSKPGRTYPGQAALLYQYQSFTGSKDGNVTLGTVVAMARLGGWKKPVQAPPEPAAFQVALPALWHEMHTKILESCFIPQPGFVLAAVGALVSAVFQRGYLSPSGSPLSMYQWIVGGTGIGKNAPFAAVSRVASRMDVTTAVGKLSTHAGLFEKLRLHTSIISTQDECFDLVSEAHGRGRSSLAEELFSTLLSLYSESSSIKPTATAKNAAVAPVLNPRLSWFATMTDEDLHASIALPGFVKGGFFGRLNVWASVDRPPEQQAKPLDVDSVHRMIASLDERMNRGKVVPMVGVPFNIPKVISGGRIETHRELRKAERVWVWASLIALTEGRTRVEEGDLHLALGIDSYQTQQLLRFLSKPMDMQDLDMIEHEVHEFMARNDCADEYELRKHVGAMNYIPSEIQRAFIKRLRREYPTLN